MKCLRQQLFLLTILILTGNAYAQLAELPSGDYSVDKSHAYITFSYSHIGFSKPQVGFDSFDLDLDFNADNPEMSALNVTIDATSVESRVEEFNEHLNGANFFDTANHPEITFQSTSISRTGDGSYDVVGDLTIKGVTKPVTLNTTIIKAGMHPLSKAPTIGMTGEATVNRSDWGLSRAVPMVSDEVTITVTAEMPKTASD